MAKFDPAKFNTDPKHQEQRDFLDAITLESIKRIKAKMQKEKPEDEDGGLGDFFDFLKGE